MPHGPGARVPARPDGTEGEDCSIRQRYSNEKMRREGRENACHRSADAERRYGEARAARRRKSAPPWQGRMEFRLAFARWCSALIRWREDKAMILHCKSIPAGDTARLWRFHAQR